MSVDALVQFFETYVRGIAWDTGEELYMKLPVLGLVMRALGGRLAA